MKTTLYQPTPEDRERWRLTAIRACKEEIERYNRIMPALTKAVVAWGAAAVTLEKNENMICVVKEIDLEGL